MKARRGRAFISFVVAALFLPFWLEGSPLASRQNEKQIEESLQIFNRAKILHQEKRYQEAVREYRRSIKIDAQNPWVFNALGLALTALRQLDEAADAFRKALDLNPDLTDIHNNLGVVYSEKGDWERAFREFTVVVRDPTYPTPEKALYNLGNIYLRQKNYELALMHFRRSVEKRTDFALGYRGLGKAHLGLGEIEPAEAQFQKAVELYPEDVESLYELARLNDQRKNAEKAREFYRRVVEVDRFSPLGKLSMQRLDELRPSS